MISHLRIVAAFVIREIATRYGRSPGGYIWAFIEPIAFISIMSFLTSFFGRLPAVGDSFPLFYATGYLAYSMYKGMEGYLSSSISANRALITYPNVAPIDMVVARFILQGITSAVVSVLILTGTMFTVHHAISIQFGAILEAVAYAWVLALGMALMNIVLFFRFPLYAKVFGIAMRPLYFLSGVFYIPGSMPHPFREILLDNPITHIVMLFREGFYGASVAEGLDLWFLDETSLSMLFIGLLIFTLWPVARIRD
ncbi:ABC transporter permease [Neorhizobium petrolearium]|uniref:ABC transporter permease n=1 Tax=Neorhizobium petrolearium TaxID=515361 RepID=UPI003F5CEC53